LDPLTPEKTSTGTLLDVTRSARRNPAANLTAEERAIYERPWQFDYGPLDLETCAQIDFDKRYQLEAQGIVFRHIRDAMQAGAATTRGIVPTCGDGYYGIYALKHGAGRMHFVSVRHDRPHAKFWHFRQTQLASKLLGVKDRCTFDTAEIADLKGTFGFGILTDVLVHCPDPGEVLQKMRSIVQGPLVVFTTTVRRGLTQFILEVGPPHRPHGACFSHDAVITMAVEAGWTVVNEQRKIMPEDWPGERQMSSFLCV
jgi:hypothetical protein